MAAGPGSGGRPAWDEGISSKRLARQGPRTKSLRLVRLWPPWRELSHLNGSGTGSEPEEGRTETCGGDALGEEKNTARFLPGGFPICPTALNLLTPGIQGGD